MGDTFADMRTHLPIRICTPYKIGKSNSDYFWETAITFHYNISQFGEQTITKNGVHQPNITPGTQCILRVQTPNNYEKAEDSLKDPLMDLDSRKYITITEAKRTY